MVCYMVLREAAKKFLIYWPLVLSGHILFELQKSGPAFTPPPPLSGRATNFFAASLEKQYKRVEEGTLLSLQIIIELIIETPRNSH